MLLEVGDCDHHEGEVLEDLMVDFVMMLDLLSLELL